MKVACCFSGSNQISSKYKEFLKNFETIKFFNYNHPDDKFEKNIQKLFLDKQTYELSNRDFFDICIYINTDITIDHELPFVNHISPNTIYTISEWVLDREVFGQFSNFYVDQNFFYCDSKTFNVIGTYNKYIKMLENEYNLPPKTFFYGFLQNMGITNSSINNIQENFNKINARWIERA